MANYFTDVNTMCFLSGTQQHSFNSEDPVLKVMKEVAEVYKGRQIPQVPVEPDDCQAIGHFVTAKLRSLDARERAIAHKAIAEIFYDIEINKT